MDMDRMMAGIKTAPDPDQDINELYALSRRPLSQENGADPPLRPRVAAPLACGEARSVPHLR